MNWRTITTLVAGALAAGAAQAQPEKPGGIWEGCGGDVRPSGMSKFMVGPKMAAAYQPKTPPTVTIEQCTAALDALGAAAPWQSRAAFLRSRARAYVAEMKPDQALADLAAIRAIEQSDPIYARSFGLSLTMLQAIALIQKQDFDGAVAAAEAAMAQRPFSDRIAMFAFRVMTAAGGHAEARRKLLDRLVRDEPDMLQLRAIERMADADWTGAAKDWPRVTPAPGTPSTTYIQLPNVRVTGAPGIPLTDVDEARTGRAALAFAMAGMTDKAKAVLATARAGLAKPLEPPAFLKGIKTDLPAPDRGKTLDRWSVLVDAAIAWRAGQAAQAADLIKTLDWTRADQIELAFLKTTGQGGGAIADPKAAIALLEAERTQRLRVRFRPDELLSELPDHEEGSKTNPYRKSVMFLRASGFRVEPSKSGFGTDIHMFGDKLTALAVSEMALLRAADMALAEGKGGFVITDRRGYRQTMQQTIYGSPIGPVANAGNGVDLTVVAVDAANMPPQLQGSEDRIFDARAVRDALAPLYAAAPPAK